MMFVSPANADEGRFRLHMEVARSADIVDIPILRRNHSNTSTRALSFTTPPVRRW